MPYDRALPRLFSVLLLIVLWSGPLHAQEPARTLADTVPLDPDGQVAIDTYKGSVTLTTWDRNEVKYEVRIESDGDPDLVEWTTIDIDREADRLRLETNYDEAKQSASREEGMGLWSNDASVRLPLVHYTLTVPRTAEIAIGDYKSTIEVRDVQAGVELETYKGTLALASVGGPVDVETYKGEGTLNAIAGALTIDTYKGHVQVEALSGALAVDTYKGTVDVQFDEATGDIDAETYKGSVTVHLPSDTGFTLAADLGDKANIATDFFLEGMQTDDSSCDTGECQETTVNGGGLRIELESYKGQFAIRSR